MFGVSFGELLSDMAGGKVPPGLLGELLLLGIPQLLNTIMPLAVFVAVIWGMGRIYRDQEMAVMRASGFSWVMMLRPLMSLLIPLSAVLFINGVFIAPSAARAGQLKLEEAFRTASEWGLKTGQFHVLQNGNLILYVEAIEQDGHTLKNIFIQQHQGEREQVWTAEQGYYWLDSTTGERYLTLENGQITEGGESSLDFGIMQFSRNDLRLPVPDEANQQPGVDSKSSRELIASNSAEDLAEVQWRVSPAIAIIVLGLLAIPLSHSPPREGRGARVIIGILAYVVYANVLHMSRLGIESGTIPPNLGLWWIHALTLVIAVFWLRRQGRMVGSA
jgi:lipopolysaccharide export system permease protein